MKKIKANPTDVHINGNKTTLKIEHYFYNDLINLDRFDADLLNLDKKRGYEY